MGAISSFFMTYKANFFLNDVDMHTTNIRIKNCKLSCSLSYNSLQGFWDMLYFILNIFINFANIFFSDLDHYMGIQVVIIYICVCDAISINKL